MLLIEIHHTGNSFQTYHIFFYLAHTNPQVFVLFFSQAQSEPPERATAAATIAICRLRLGSGRSQAPRPGARASAHACRPRRARCRRRAATQSAARQHLDQAAARAAEQHARGYIQPRRMGRGKSQNSS